MFGSLFFTFRLFGHLAELIGFLCDLLTFPFCLFGCFGEFCVSLGLQLGLFTLSLLCNFLELLSSLQIALLLFLFLFQFFPSMLGFFLDALLFCLLFLADAGFFSALLGTNRRRRDVLGLLAAHHASNLVADGLEQIASGSRCIPQTKVDTQKHGSSRKNGQECLDNRICRNGRRWRIACKTGKGIAGVGFVGETLLLGGGRDARRAWFGDVFGWKVVNGFFHGGHGQTSNRLHIHDTAFRRGVQDNVGHRTNTGRRLPSQCKPREGRPRHLADQRGRAVKDKVTRGGFLTSIGCLCGNQRGQVPRGTDGDINRVVIASGRIGLQKARDIGKNAGEEQALWTRCVVGLDGNQQHHTTILAQQSGIVERQDGIVLHIVHTKWARMVQCHRLYIDSHSIEGKGKWNAGCQFELGLQGKPSARRNRTYTNFLLRCVDLRVERVGIGVDNLTQLVVGNHNLLAKPRRRLAVVLSGSQPRLQFGECHFTASNLSHIVVQTPTLLNGDGTKFTRHLDGRCGHTAWNGQDACAAALCFLNQETFRVS